MNTAFLTVSIIGLVTYTVFIIAYHTKTRGAWCHSQVGRWLMLGRANVAALFLFIVTNRIVEHWPGEPRSRQITLLVLYSLFALQALWPLSLLWREEMPTPRERKSEDHDSRT